jgi:3'-5' exoribonuclease
MEYIHVKDIDFQANINNRVFGIFLARDVDVRLQKDGKTKFIAFNMCDKEFKIDAKKFGASDSEIQMMHNGGVYCGAIDIKPYAKSPTGYSCTIYNFDVYNEDPANFVEWAEGMDEAQETIQSALSIISESVYKDLVYNILVNHWSDFCIWTAASGMHHNVLGGLIVHTAEVIDQCDILADYWDAKYGPNFINKPLLLSGALLHDIAKTLELDVDRNSGSTSYSKESALETHITMCVSLIDIEAYRLRLGYQTYTINEVNEQTPEKPQDQLDFELEAVALLKHLILAHHGQKEFGSPISMNVPEAYILNKADEMSAEMYRYNKNFNTMDEATSSAVWLGGNMVVTYKDSTK